MLRAAVAAGSPLGQQAKAIMDSGGLVSDDIIVGLVKERLAEPDCQAGCLFDGFPRTIPQAEALATITEVTHVIAIEVPDERIVERICGRYSCAGCGSVFHDTFNPVATEGCDCGNWQEKRRADDNEGTVLSRLNAYHEQTSPLATWYESAGIFHRIDGDRAIDDITGDILAALK